MDYNLIFIIISIFIAFLLTNYFLIGFIKHFIFKKETFSNAYPTGFCSHEGKLGIRLFNGSTYSCVSMDDTEAEDVQSNRQFGPNTNESSNTGSGNGNNSASASGNNSASASGDNNESNDNSNTGEESGEPNNNFKEGQCISPDKIGEICKVNGKGIKEIKKDICPGNNVQVTCGNLTFDEIDYSNEGKYVYATDCINNAFDMDTICNQMMPKSINQIAKQNGYYNQSAGADVILKGKSGDCYTHDGSPDLSKSRAICNLQSNKEIKRIFPFNDNQDYNVFTNCNNMESHNFVDECKNLLKLKSNKDVFADIHGFDCMPGYARAKCINKEEAINIPNDIKKLKHDSRGNIYPY